MERFSRFRDKGSGISPFLPITSPASLGAKAWRSCLFLFRLPLFLSFAIVYVFFVHYLPIPLAIRKLLLWCLMGVPGIWWTDLQLDGVRRGTAADQPPDRFPHAGSIIAATLTSPIDALYLAAIFDPIFTASYPATRQVEQLSLFGAIMLPIREVRLRPPYGATLVDIETLREQNPDRIIVVFPEAGSTNGKAVLPFAPSLTEASPETPIFPVSLRYTPADVTTPVPGRFAHFLWDLLSRPNTCIRVRVAEQVFNVSGTPTNGVTYGDHAGEGHALRRRAGVSGDEAWVEGYLPVSAEEKRVLDKIAEDLARLGRSKRVGLTLKDKVAFVDAWRDTKSK